MMGDRMHIHFYLVLRIKLEHFSDHSDLLLLHLLPNLSAVSKTSEITGKRGSRGFTKEAELISAKRSEGGQRGPGPHVCSRVIPPPKHARTYTQECAQPVTLAPCFILAPILGPRSLGKNWPGSKSFKSLRPLPYPGRGEEKKEKEGKKKKVHCKQFICIPPSADKDPPQKAASKSMEEGLQRMDRLPSLALNCENERVRKEAFIRSETQR